MDPELLTVGWLKENEGQVIEYYGIWEPGEMHFYGQAYFTGFDTRGEIRANTLTGSKLNECKLVEHWDGEEDERNLVWGDNRPVFRGRPPFQVWKVIYENEGKPVEVEVINDMDWQISDVTELLGGEVFLLVKVYDPEEGWGE